MKTHSLTAPHAERVHQLTAKHASREHRLTAVAVAVAKPKGNLVRFKKASEYAK